MVPAFVWRGGRVRRGVTVGVCAGLFFGVLAWLDSGMLISAVIVFVVLGVGCGLWMERRMIRYRPRTDDLTGAQRVAVVVDYGRALRAAADEDTPLRRVVVVVLLVVAAAMALWDAVHGSLGNVVASVVYLVLVLLELFWWPKRREELVTNAERAAAMVSQTDVPDRP
jgi:hypothetical protein